VPASHGRACNVDLVMPASAPLSPPPPFRSERFVFSVAVATGHFKVVQLVFQKSDGSLFVTFPYGPNCEGLVSVATISANESELDLKPGGKIASHLVKYAHHPDGATMRRGCGEAREGRNVGPRRHMSEQRPQMSVNPRAVERWSAMALVAVAVAWGLMPPLPSAKEARGR
jgi:hypothetical protein